MQNIFQWIKAKVWPMAYSNEDRVVITRIEKKLDTLNKMLQTTTTNLTKLVLTNIQEGEKIMASLDDLIVEVADQTSVITSASVLLDGLTEQVQALRDDLAAAGQDTAKIDAVLLSLQSNKTALAEAVTRNTDAEDEQPV